MKRSELEYLIRAAGSIADDTEIVVIGSQAILDQFPEAPAKLLVSAEAVLERLTQTETSTAVRELAEARIQRDFAHKRRS